MSKLNSRYWLQTEPFFNNDNSNIPPKSSYNDSKSQTQLSRFQLFPECKRFCNKPTLLYTTQYPKLFITSKEGFDMHTGKRHSVELPEDELYDKITTQLISGKLIHNQKELLFPARNSSNNFFTIEYKAHINPKIDCSISQVFQTRSVAELNTLQIVCDFEKTQLLTILAMFGKNP